MVRARAVEIPRRVALAQTQPPELPSDFAPMSFADAVDMLPGLEKAVQTTEEALKKGARCQEVSAADLEVARTFRDQMSQFVAAGVKTQTLRVQKAWLDAASKVVKCAVQAEEAAPNTGAYVALGAVVIAAIVALAA